MERGRGKGKTGCREARGAERGEGRGRDEKCAAREGEKNEIKNQLRSESEYKLLENKSSV